MHKHEHHKGFILYMHICKHKFTHMQFFLLQILLFLKHIYIFGFLLLSVHPVNDAHIVKYTHTECTWMITNSIHFTQHLGISHRSCLVPCVYVCVCAFVRSSAHTKALVNRIEVSVHNTTLPPHTHLHVYDCVLEE